MDLAQLNGRLEPPEPTPRDFTEISTNQRPHPPRHYDRQPNCQPNVIRGTARACREADGRYAIQRSVQRRIKE